MTWDEVVEAYRRFEPLKSIWPTAAAMLRLVARLRDDPRFEGVDRCVSHLTLRFGPIDATRNVGICWSEPDGWGWAGREGWVVEYVDYGAMTSSDRIIVTGDEVVERIVAYLSALG